MIQELQTERLDINNKYEVFTTCKQGDNLKLKIIVYDKSLPADLSNYTCRLRAFKRDQMPLIQNTGITITNNIVYIEGDEQLTTTAGIVKAELQFVHKTTLQKKSSFYIIFNVISSVFNVDGAVSTPTCTLLKQLENDLDRVENIGYVLEDAKDTRDDLIVKTDAANTSNENLVNSTSTADTTKNALDTLNTNANTTKLALDTANTTAVTNKNNLDVANVQAVKNYEALEQLGDATDLAKKVEAQGSQLNESVNDISVIKKDYAKKTDVNDLVSSKAEKVDLQNINNVVSKNVTDIVIQSARIDEFTKLEEGSTTGDAELIDARVGKNGLTYNNAGDNIRNIANGIGIIDKSILPQKVSFINIEEKQFFDEDLWIKNKYYVFNETNGITTGYNSDNTWSIYEPVLLEKNTEYYIENVNGLLTFLVSLDGKKLYKKFSNIDETFTGKFTTDNYCYLYSTRFKTNINSILVKATSMWNDGISKEKEKLSIPNLDLNEKIEYIEKNCVFSKNTIQLINPYTLKKGYYVIYYSGYLVQKEGYYATDYIKIDISLKYKYNWKFGNAEQGAFYDSNKEYISGFTEASQLNSDSFIIPSSAKYIRLTLTEGQQFTSIFAQSDSVPEYVPYGGQLNYSDIKGIHQKTVDIVVDKNGTRDFTKIIDAIDSIKDSSKYNIYNIYINDGEYDILEELGGQSWLDTITSSSSGEMFGLNIPPYVNLIGVGSVTLSCELPDSSTLAQSTKISTVNIYATNNIENLTIIAKNCRYAVHDETNNSGLNKNLRRKIKNCKLIHRGNLTGLWQSTQAYAAGTDSGGIYEFDQCVFETNSIPFSIHNNSNQKRNIVSLKNCDFIGDSNNYGLRFGSYGVNSEQQNLVYLDNCRSNGIPRCVVEGSYNTYSNKWLIKVGTSYFNTNENKLKILIAEDTWGTVSFG